MLWKKPKNRPRGWAQRAWTLASLTTAPAVATVASTATLHETYAKLTRNLLTPTLRETYKPYKPYNSLALWGRLKNTIGRGGLTTWAIGYTHYVISETNTRTDTQGLALRAGFVNLGETPIALEGQTMTTFFFTLTTIKGYYRTVPVSARGLNMALDTINNMYPRANIITITF